MNNADGKALVSYKAGLNEKDPTGFKAYRLPLDNVAKMVKSAGQYSAVQFREGYRDAAHAIPFSELIILDYDDGFTLSDAVEMFGQYIGIVATTRSHQKEKHGIVCDRFRLILPVRKPVKLDAVEFSKMMKEVILHYATDRACSNMSRMYYGFVDAEVSFLSGSHLFDWEPFYQSARDKERERQYRKPMQHASCDRDAADLDKYVNNVMRKNYKPGARNNVLFWVARQLREAGYCDVAGKVAALNTVYGCPPLEPDEVNKIVRNAITPKH